MMLLNRLTRVKILKDIILRNPSAIIGGDIVRVYKFTFAIFKEWTFNDAVATDPV